MFKFCGHILSKFSNNGAVPNFSCILIQCDASKYMLNAHPSSDLKGLNFVNQRVQRWKSCQLEKTQWSPFFTPFSTLWVGEIPSFQSIPLLWKACRLSPRPPHPKRHGHPDQGTCPPAGGSKPCTGQRLAAGRGGAAALPTSQHEMLDTQMAIEATR